MISLFQVSRVNRNKRLINDKGPSLVDFIENSRRLIDEYPLVWSDNDPIDFSVNPDECVFWRSYWYTHGRRDLVTGLDGKFSYIQFAHKDVTLGLNRDRKQYEFLIMDENKKLYHPNRLPKNVKRNTEKLGVISTKDIIDSSEAVKMILNDSSIQQHLSKLENRHIDTVTFEAMHSMEQRCTWNSYGHELIYKAAQELANGEQTIFYEWKVEQFSKGAEAIHRVHAIVDARKKKVVATMYDKHELKGCPGI